MGLPRIVTHPKDKGEDRKLIYIRYTYQGKIIYFSAGINTKEKDLMRDKKGRIKEEIFKADAPNLIRNRKSIRHQKTAIQDAIDSLEQPTVSEVKRVYKGESPTRASVVTFFEYFDRWKDRHKNEYSKDYLRKVDSVKVTVKEFNPKLTFDFNQNDLTGYTNYLIGKGLLNSTVRSHAKFIKLNLKESFIEGLHTNRFFEEIRQRTPERSQPFWLTWDEVKLLEEFTHFDDGHNKVKDLFVLNCYLGLRDSDFRKVLEENIQEMEGVKVVQISTTKDKELIPVPISKRADKILQKYNYTLPTYSQQKINEYIKMVAKAAGIKGDFKEVKHSGREQIEVVKPRWKCVTTHTARRTFARYWADSGKDINMLSKFLGHSSPHITMQYIGYDFREIHAEMLDLFDG